jgi:parvulin-like peptidyl-prolyl isomerase
MIKEFEDAVWALEIGAHSGVVESIYGFHIIERTR